jgi:hypothetical protein
MDNNKRRVLIGLIGPVLDSGQGHSGGSVGGPPWRFASMKIY